MVDREGMSSSFIGSGPSLSARVPDDTGSNEGFSKISFPMPSNAISTRVSIDRLILGSIPDIGFAGD